MPVLREICLTVTVPPWLAGVYPSSSLPADAEGSIFSRLFNHNCSLFGLFFYIPGFGEGL